MSKYPNKLKYRENIVYGSGKVVNKRIYYEQIGVKGGKNERHIKN